MQNPAAYLLGLGPDLTPGVNGSKLSPIYKSIQTAEPWPGLELTEPGNPTLGLGWQAWISVLGFILLSWVTSGKYIHLSETGFSY